MGRPGRRRDNRVEPLLVHQGIDALVAHEASTRGQRIEIRLFR